MGAIQSNINQLLQGTTQAAFIFQRTPLGEQMQKMQQAKKEFKLQSQLTNAAAQETKNIQSLKKKGIELETAKDLTNMYKESTELAEEKASYIDSETATTTREIIATKGEISNLATQAELKYKLKPSAAAYQNLLERKETIKAYKKFKKAIKEEARK